MIDEWSPDPDVSCAVPDVLPVAWFVAWSILGAVVIAAALVMWILKHGQAS